MKLAGNQADAHADCKSGKKPSKMIWFFLALFCAFCLATADALTKKYFSGYEPHEMALARLVYTVPWLLVVFLFIPWKKPEPEFWLWTGIGVPLEVIAIVMYVKALKVSPFSLTLPFISFTPAFVILTGFILLGENISLSGASGILAIVAGSYIMNISSIKNGFFAPFMAISREQGSRLMAIVSIIYAITGVSGKKAIQYSDPFFFGITYFVLITASLVLVTPFLGNGRKISVFSGNIKAGFATGFFSALMIISHMAAISQIEAAYMIAIKRTSGIFAVLYGAFLFGENRIGERFSGAIVMAGGVIWICVMK